MSAGVKGLQKIATPRLTVAKQTADLATAVAPGNFEAGYIVDLSYGPDATTLGNLTDISRNGRHMIQTTGANRPTLQTRSGGRRVARFDGSNDYLSCANGPAPEQISIVACVSLASAPAANNGIFGTASNLGANDFTSGLCLHQGTSGGANVNFLRTEGAKAAPATDLLTTTIPFNELFVFSLIMDDTIARLFINGQEDGVIAATANSLDAYGMVLGARIIGGAASYLGMDLRGFLVYSKALTREERLAAEAIV